MNNILDFLIIIKKQNDSLYKYLMKTIWIFLLLVAGEIYYIRTLYNKPDKTLFIIHFTIFLVCVLFGVHFFFYFNFYENSIMSILEKIYPQIKNYKE